MDFSLDAKSDFLLSFEVFHPQPHSGGGNEPFECAHFNLKDSATGALLFSTGLLVSAGVLGIALRRRRAA